MKKRPGDSVVPHWVGSNCGCCLCAPLRFAGKRCIVSGCMRQAYERTNNYCNNHFQELHGDAAAVVASPGSTEFPDDDAMEEEEKTETRR